MVHQHQLVGFGDRLLASAHVLAHKFNLVDH